jgi:hypothetical protein
VAKILPVPQYIEDCPVIAAIAVLARPGEPPFEFVVICQQHDPPLGAGPYVVWRVGTSDGRQWIARHRHHGLTWLEAVTIFAARASLPAPGTPLADETEERA